MTAMIFDTETTSRNDDREIIEAAGCRVELVNDLAGPSQRIALPIAGPVWQRRFKPSVSIEYGAMAVHNILPCELEDCPPSSSFEFPGDVKYIIGHSVDFDWEAAGKPDVKRICTDAMARWVWQDADSYSQSALLYMLLGPTPETRDLLTGAHSAVEDVLNNARLLQGIIEARPDLSLEDLPALYEFSEQCRMPRVIPFGKWKDHTPAEVLDMDPGYVDWLHRQDWVDPYLIRAFAEV